MKQNNLGGYLTINAFVRSKLRKFRTMERSFSSLFELMFSERGNVLFEKSEGYRIEKTTYGQSYERILRRATTLREQLNDISPNSVIGIYMDNSPDWIELFWSILKCGHRPLLMNLRMEEQLLFSAMREVGTAAVISDGKLFPVKTILAAHVTPAELPDGDAPFGEELLVMSSGTSNHVKLCAYTAQEIWYQINDSYGIIRRCRRMKRHYKGELKLLTFLPFYHVFGLIAVYIWFAFFSRTFVQLNDFSPQTIVNTIRRHQVTHIFAVPLFWNRVYAQAVRTIKERGEKTWQKFCRGLRLAQKPLIGGLVTRFAFRQVREQLFGESVCFMISGGSEVRGQILEFFNGIGYRLANGYGMTEIGITSVELSGRKHWLCGCYVGKPLSSFEYRIGADGTLLVRGKAVASRIIGDGSCTAGGDWFATRDLAECRGGHYRILGRRDDLVVSPTGENLNPNLIEPLFAHIGREVCLIADRGSGQPVPTLLVSVGRGISAQGLAALRERLAARLNELRLNTEIVKTVFVVEELMGADDIKLNRTRIAKHFVDGEMTEVTPELIAAREPEEDVTLRQIKLLFATALGKQPDEISYTADFFLDEGGTSLDYFALVAQLQGAFSVAFPTAAGKSLNTPKAFHDYIKAAQDDAN